HIPVGVAVLFAILLSSPLIVFGPVFVCRLGRELFPREKPRQNRTRKVALVFFILTTMLAACSLVLGLVDLHRVRHFHWPLFCYAKEMYLDGGSIMHFGFGYRIRCWHQYSGDDVLVGSDIRWWPFYE
ncbi:MAG: hypothetical protein CUN54_10405, partial [Phototrophicales bacterium]